MNQYLEQISVTARRAVQARDWVRVRACAREILRRSRTSAEAYFLMGLAENASNAPDRATKSFSKALSLDERRYDAAIELAGQYLRSHQYGEAVALLRRYESDICNSPRYLEMAGTAYMKAGLPEKGLPLYQRANDLQPGVDALLARTAACNVFVGKLDDAKDIYRRLLKKHPDHQRNHYELSRIERATDRVHVEQMKSLLRSNGLTPDKNIYLYYAIGKELEDLEQWDEAFHYYKMGGDAVAGVANYDLSSDLRLIDRIIEVCNEDWLADESKATGCHNVNKTPVFIVGLPRTGTTLIDRVLSCHSKIESAGESYLMQIVLKRTSGVKNAEGMSPNIIEAAARLDMRRIANGYLGAIGYRLGAKPLFIEKFPENFLYLGFIARAFPHARLILANRNPMDTCFALYKQSFFRYAYTLDDIGRYIVAYNRLIEHWRRMLKNRLIEVHYEQLVNDQEGQTRKLLEALGLEFEAACLHFEKNETATNTASAVQIREKIHSRSVNRWKCFEGHLRPLRDYLVSAGMKVD